MIKLSCRGFSAKQTELNKFRKISSTPRQDAPEHAEHSIDFAVSHCSSSSPSRVQAATGACRTSTAEPRRRRPRQFRRPRATEVKPQNAHRPIYLLRPRSIHLNTSASQSMPSQRTRQIQSAHAWKMIFLFRFNWQICRKPLRSQIYHIFLSAWPNSNIFIYLKSLEPVEPFWHFRFLF